MHGATNLSGERLRRLLIATDFSPGARRALARAARLPLAPDAMLALVHVLPGSIPGRASRRVETTVRRLLADAAASLRETLKIARSTAVVQVALLTGPLLPELGAYAATMKAEFLVVGRHGEGRLRGLLLGSTAERLIRRAPMPVLVVGPEPRGPYKRPMVGVDASPDARAIVELAARLCTTEAHRFDVFHAFENVYRGWMRMGGATDAELARYLEDLKGSAHKALNEALEGLPIPGRRRRLVFRRGEPRRAILGAIGRRRADLVAIGSRARGGAAHLFLGSVAQEILHRAPCDVLVVRTPKVVVDSSP